jgi:hypothetical protein
LHRRDRYRYQQFSGDQVRVLVLRPEGQWTIDTLRKDTPINVGCASCEAAAIIDRGFTGVFAKGGGK